MHQIGIIGLGHLGEIHLKQWLEIVPAENIYCFDSDSDKLGQVTDRYSVNKTSDFTSLLNLTTIVDVVTPTQFHHLYASEALKSGKHVFIEKPVCVTMEELNDLILIQKESGTLVQIGHVERYNPAFVSVKNQIDEPKFFEVHRLAPFVPRGTEVSVIMDLMIHDLDIILHLVNSSIKEVWAKGVAIISTTPDIANVRLEFNNGCVANLTASRISMKKMRKMRIFSNQGYIAIDFLDKSAEVMKIADSGQGLAFTMNDGSERFLQVNVYDNLNRNAIFEELYDFYHTILNRNKSPEIDLLSASKTMELALKIQSLL